MFRGACLSTKSTIIDTALCSSQLQVIVMTLCSHDQASEAKQDASNLFWHLACMYARNQVLLAVKQ